MATLELRNLSIRRRGGSEIGPIDVTVAPGEPLALVDKDRDAVDAILKALTIGSGIGGGEINVTDSAPRLARVGAPLLKPSRHSVERILQGELKRARVPKDLWTPQVNDVLKLVGLERHKDWRLNDLSEGRLLRASLAAVLVTKPTAIVVDRPMTMGAHLPQEEVRNLFQDVSKELEAPVVLLCESVEDAFALGVEVAIFDQGKLLQVGTPLEVYRRPLNRSVAVMGGEANIITGHVVRTGAGFVLAETAAGKIQAAVAGDSKFTDGQPVMVMIRPEAIKIERMMTDDDCLAGEIERIVFKGQIARYWFRSGQVVLKVDELHPRYFSTTEGPLYALVDPDDAVAMLH